MTNPMRGPELKIATACKRAQAVRELIHSYMASLTFGMVEEVNAEGDRLLLIKSPQKLDDDLFVAVAELGYHLRSALDQTIVAIAQANSGTGKGCYYPFAESKEEFGLPKTQRKIKQLPQDVRDLIIATKPYADGNAELWGLGRLANIDKHNSLVPMADASQIVSLLITNATFDGVKGLMIPPKPNSISEEILFCNLGTSGTVTFAAGPPKFGLVVDVRFGAAVPVFGGQPVADTLDRLIDCAEGIIKALKSHCFGQ